MDCQPNQALVEGVAGSWGGEVEETVLNQWFSNQGGVDGSI